MKLFLFSCPPRVFLPALCRVFLDESAPENVLEVTARAITYYLDVSAECTRRIVAVDGAVKVLCNRLVAVDLLSRTSKDLAEQCVKVWLTFDLFRSTNLSKPANILYFDARCSLSNHYFRFRDLE